MKSRAAAPQPLLSSLVAGPAGFYADAHHSVVRGCTRAASGGGASAVVLARSWRATLASTLRTPQCGARLHLCSLGRRRLGCRPARSSRALLAPTLTRTTVWRKAAPVRSQAAAPLPSPSSRFAGRAGFCAGVHHGVVRGCTRAASGGGASAVAQLARRGLRWLLRWRAPQCGARLHPCSRRGRRLCRHTARSSRAALASTLARTTVWCEAALV